MLRLCDEFLTLQRVDFTEFGTRKKKGIRQLPDAPF